MQRWRPLVAMVVLSLVAAGASWAFVRQAGVSERPRVGATNPVESSVVATPAAPTTPDTTAPGVTTTSLAENEPRIDLGEVPVVSGRPEDVAVPLTRKPVRLSIADLAIDVPIESVGYDVENDEMEIPGSVSVAGWYEFSATPGDGGSSVVAAHVDWNGRRGPFFDLYLSEVGTRIVVEFDDGTTSEFEVTAAEQYDKRALPTDDIFTRTGAPVLTLITCGGVFNEAVRSYEDNIVVFAVPVP